MKKGHILTAVSPLSVTFKVWIVPLVTAVCSSRHPECEIQENVKLNHFLYKKIK